MICHAGWWSLKESVPGVCEQEGSFIPVDGVRARFLLSMASFIPRLCSRLCGFGLWGERVVVFIWCVADEDMPQQCDEGARGRCNLSRLFGLYQRKLKPGLVSYSYFSKHGRNVRDTSSRLVGLWKDKLPKIFHLFWISDPVPCAAELFKAKRSHSSAELGLFTGKAPLSRLEFVSVWCCSALQRDLQS